MKSMFKAVSILLVTMLMLAAFPTMGVRAAHYYPCNRAQFIRDVTIRDGSHFAPGATFTKTWQVKNTGYCAWTTSYTLVFDSGEQMGAPSAVNFPLNVAPGQIADLTISMTAPANPGRYRSSWKLDNGSGERFGVGWGGGVPIYALINVVVPPATTFDFAANAATAIWSSHSGTPPTFPSMPGSPNGSAIVDSTFQFESGVTATPGLLVTPDNSYHGYIQAEYPPYRVAHGDHFQATVGCEVNAINCYVIFKLKYRIGAGREYTLGTYPERREGLTRNVDINLNYLAGKDVSFILFVSAYRSPFDDKAIWGNPVIVGTGVPSTISPTGWSSNDMGDFTFDFPSNSVVNNVSMVSLPIVPGTNLNEKFVEVGTKQLAAAGDECLSSNPGASAATPVTFNGVEFMKETGSEGGAGNFQDWVSYSATHPSEPLTCVTLTFVLQYSNAGNFDPPRPEFNHAAESAVFDMIMGRFKWVFPPE